MLLLALSLSLFTHPFKTVKSILCSQQWAQSHVLSAYTGLILMSFCLFRFPMISMFKAETESIQTWQISLDLIQISKEK